VSEFPNDEQRNQYITALIQEREAYESRGNKTKAQAVTVELQRLGAEGKPKAKRAEKRPVEQAKETR
jgi:hypothetical protein